MDIIINQIEDIKNHLLTNKLTISPDEKINLNKQKYNLYMKCYRIRNSDKLKQYNYDKYHNEKKFDKNFMEYHNLATKKYNLKKLKNNNNVI